MSSVRSSELDVSTITENHWWQATDLFERIHMDIGKGRLTLCNEQSISQLSQPYNYDAQQGELKYERWQKETGLGIDNRLQERLDPLHTSASTFKYLLGETTAALSQRMAHEKPSWQIELEEILYSSEKACPLTDSELLTEEKPSPTSQDFLLLTLPIVRTYCTSLYRQLKSEFPDQTEHLLSFIKLAIPAINLQFYRMIVRTLLIELQIEKIQEQLVGDSPEERYQHFVNKLKKADRAVRLFSEYPVLARQLLNRARQWKQFHAEFFQRLSADRDIICRQFTQSQALGNIVAIAAHQGDRHDDGRSVMLITFSCGLNLVYKPKPLTIDARFQHFLAWVNKIGFKPRLPTLKILDRTRYGWCQFIPHTGCEEESEVQRFYQRQGAYLAILYALEATDFHYENIIACGEQPYLIDLETLLQPHIKDTTAVGPGSRLSNATIMRSGMMPNLHVTYRDKPMVDLSGLGNSYGRPTLAAELVNIGQDTLRLKTVNSEMRAGQNQPLLNGKPCIVQDYAEDVIQGFTSMYRLLLANKNTLLDTYGPLSQFQELRTRFIIRGTDLYVRLLHAAFHPDYLQNGLMRDRLYDKLWLDYEFYPAVRQLIPSEQAALARSDVPLFTTKPNSCSIFDDQGREFKNFFPRTGMEQCHIRIKQLSANDLALQHRILRDTLTGLHPSPWSKILQPDKALEAVSPQLLEQTAERLGQRIRAQLIQQNNCTGLIQPILQGDNGWVMTSIGISLYDGLAGLTVFFAALAHQTQRSDYSKSCNDIWDTLLRRTRDNPRALEAVGAYSGWGGLFYAASIRSRMGFSSPDEADILLWCQRLRRDLPKDKNYDFIAGAAGAILGLLRFYEQQPHPEILSTAIACGQHLLEHAHAHSGGVAWHCEAADGMELTGMGHGAAGIIQSLMLLSRVTSDKQYLSLAQQALTFEDNWFSDCHCNWQDRRKSDTEEQDQYVVAWCHGAPGIGLARLVALQSFSELSPHKVRTDLERAVTTTLNSTYGHNQSLCHGDLGNLELLSRASRILKRPELQQFVDDQLKRIIPLLIKNEYRSGTQLDAAHFTFMNGLSGMAYQLLSFAHPGRYPSVLTLD